MGSVPQERNYSYSGELMSTPEINFASRPFMAALPNKLR